MPVVKQSFEKWAKSFSGYCEGDLGAPLWICGLEPSSANLDSLGVDASGLQREIEEVGPPIITPKPMNVATHQTFPYGKKMLVLAGAVLGSHTPEAKQLLKLNLYPFAAPNMKSWTDVCRDSSGFDYKADYQAWCRTERFPMFLRLVAERQPKVIVGTGLGYVDAYLAAFAGTTGEQEVLQVSARDVATISHGGKSARCRRFDIRHSSSAPTRLYVVPFLSFRRGCLNDTALIESVGRYIGADSGLSDLSPAGT